MDNMISIAICDDNELFLNGTKQKIINLFLDMNIKIQVKCFNSGTTFLKSLCADKFGLVFLDINLPDLSGFEIAEQIKMYNSEIEIIFVTNEDHLVYNSFQFRPFRFIRKSKCDNELKKVINDYVSILKLREVKLNITSSNVTIDLSIHKIKYIESKLLNKEIHICNEVIITRNTMKNLLTLLSTYGFVKIHSSFIVNYRLVYKVNRDHVLLIDGTSLPISKHLYKEANKEIAKLKMGDFI